MIFLVQIVISTSKFFKDHKVHSPYVLVHFFWSLKNLLVLIYSKFHSKSCDYLYLLWCLEAKVVIHLYIVIFNISSVGFTRKNK